MMQRKHVYSHPVPIPIHFTEAPHTGNRLLTAEMNKFKYQLTEVQTSLFHLISVISLLDASWEHVSVQVLL